MKQVKISFKVHTDLASFVLCRWIGLPKCCATPILPAVYRLGIILTTTDLLLSNLWTHDINILFAIVVSIDQNVESFILFIPWARCIFGTVWKIWTWGSTNSDWSVDMENLPFGIEIRWKCLQQFNVRSIWRHQ